MAGILFGILFGAANAYLGLRAGLTISTSIPVAVMTVAAFRLLRRAGAGGGILEANLSQTVGSASSSVASGVIFTLPALFLWGVPPTLLQMSLLALSGGLLGVLFMIPLRAFLIEREHARLPYPEGTACARVLVASEEGGGRARNVFLGLGAGALVKARPPGCGWCRGMSRSASVAPQGAAGHGDLCRPLRRRLHSGSAGLGDDGGWRAAVVPRDHPGAWPSGGRAVRCRSTRRLELTIAQMSPGLLWTRYIRYIGAGAVATAGSSRWFAVFRR